MQQPDSPTTVAGADRMSVENNNGDYVVLGKITGCFGVRGWVKVYSDTDPRENIVSYSQWWLGDSHARKPALKSTLKSIRVRTGKRSGKHVVAQLDGIDTRELAETLIGKEISVLRSSLPKLGKDEFYWTDLVGCIVEDIHGNAFGPVDRLFETGANDVMVVIDHRSDSDELNGEILIPWIRPTVVTEIDLDLKKIVVDWDPDY